MSDLQTCFRFMELPTEIRDQIYRELLCNFECEREPSEGPDSLLARLMRHMEQINGVCQASHDVIISILLVNRQVHREAFDVMVKTNQFIRIRGDNFSFSDLLLERQLPVVTMDRDHAAQFQGYLLCMDVADASDSNDDIPAVRFDFMILGRHWAALCAALSYLYTSIPDLRFHLEFDPASMVAKKGPEASIDSFFMAKIQATLLKPFRTYLRGVKALTIGGLINIDLYESVKQEVAQTPWDDLPVWVARLEEKCLLSKELQDQEQTIEASVMWKNVLEELAWVPWDDHEGRYEPPELRDRCNDIYFACISGEVRCYLQHLYDPPPGYGGYWFRTLEGYVITTIDPLEVRAMGAGNEVAHREAWHLRYRTAGLDYRSSDEE